MIAHYIRARKGQFCDCPECDSAQLIACQAPHLDAQNIYDFIMALPSKCEDDTTVFDSKDFPFARIPWQILLLTFTAKGGVNLGTTLCAWDGTSGCADAPSDAIQTAHGAVYATVTGAPGAIYGGSFRVYFRDDGSMIRADLFYPPDPSITERSRQWIQTCLSVLLVSCSFANCRNVEIKRLPLSRQQRRHAERSGEPIFEHHVIAIDPLRTILIDEGGLQTREGLARSMHICRGHFARYGASFGTGKLFGKFEGQFWVPQHIRGTSDRGVITKDYKITSASV